MKRIEQVVQLLRNECRRHREHRRLACGGPAAAQIREGLWPWEAAPVLWEIGNSNSCDLHGIWNVRRQSHVVLREILVIRVHEQFQGGKGQRGGGVDEGRSSMVPAPSEQPCAFTVESGLPRSREAPDPDQL